MLDTQIDLNETDTSMPRLIDGKYLCSIDKAEVVASKSVEGNKNLMVIYKLAEDAESTIGSSISPGYQLRRYYALQPSEKNPDWDFKTDIARLIDAAFGTSQGGRPEFNADTIAGLHGRQVIVTTKLVEGEMGLQNEVKSVLAVS